MGGEEGSEALRARVNIPRLRLVRETAPLEQAGDGLVGGREERVRAVLVPQRHGVEA